MEELYTLMNVVHSILLNNNILLKAKDKNYYLL